METQMTVGIVYGVIGGVALFVLLLAVFSMFMGGD